jgi:hypothetical protein
VNILEKYGLNVDDQRVLAPWLETALHNRGTSPITVEELAAYAAAAYMIGKEYAPRAPSGPLFPTLPPPAAAAPPPPSLPPPAPLMGAAPAAPVSLLPQGVTFGRSARNHGPGPVAVEGPPPPHVQMGPGGARVQIHDPNAPAPGGVLGGGPYVGQLQEGQTRVEITLPTGEVLPPIYKDPDGKTKITPAPLLPGATSAAAPGTLAGAMESVRLASKIGPPQIAALDAIEQGTEPDARQTMILLALNFIELDNEGNLQITQNGREARAIAQNRLKEAAAHAPG